LEKSGPAAPGQGLAARAAVVEIAAGAATMRWPKFPARAAQVIIWRVLGSVLPRPPVSRRTATHKERLPTGQNCRQPQILLTWASSAADFFPITAGRG
jgi:hypothetical protein